ncbi:MAG: 23S rRNA (adenine(2503)-C(2))-methyltransferase RlmN, partial [Methyloceanibacter sp.]
MRATSLMEPGPRPVAGVSPETEPLVGLGRPELAERLRALGVPERQVRMRVSQLWSWLYVRGVT